MELDVGPKGQVITTRDVYGVPEGSVLHDVESRGDSWYGLTTESCGSYRVAVPKDACAPFDSRIEEHTTHLVFDLWEAEGTKNEHFAGFHKLYGITPKPPVKLSPAQQVIRDRVLTRFRLGIKTQPPRGAGNYTLGVKVMIVGERTSHPDENKYHAPFCSVKACSGWLNALLEAEAIPEASIFWVNALDNDGTPMDLDRIHAHLRPGVVFALGKVAEKRLTQCKVPYVAFSHPQYHKRFKHKEPYPLIAALKTATL